MTKALREQAVDILRGETADYDSYLGGRVYGYIVEQGGEEIDACWGFVGAYETHCLPEARNAVPRSDPHAPPATGALTAYP